MASVYLDGNTSEPLTLAVGDQLELPGGEPGSRLQLLRVREGRCEVITRLANRLERTQILHGDMHCYLRGDVDHSVRALTDTVLETEPRH